MRYECISRLHKSEVLLVVSEIREEQNQDHYLVNILWKCLTSLVFSSRVDYLDFIEEDHKNEPHKEEKYIEDVASISSHVNQKNQDPG